MSIPSEANPEMRYVTEGVWYVSHKRGIVTKIQKARKFRPKKEIAVNNYCKDCLNTNRHRRRMSKHAIYERQI